MAIDQRRLAKISVLVFYFSSVVLVVPSWSISRISLASLASLAVKKVPSKRPKGGEFLLPRPTPIKIRSIGPCPVYAVSPIRNDGWAGLLGTFEAISLDGLRTNREV